MAHLSSGRTEKKGSALLVTIMYLAALTMLAAAFLTLFHRTFEQWRDAECHQLCLYIAEGGIEKALAELRLDAAAYAGEEDTPLGMGSFSVEVQPGTRRDTYRVVSTAKLGEGRFVRARARLAADIVLAPDGRIAGLHWAEEKKW